MSNGVSWDRLGSEAKRFTQQMTSFTDSPCMCRPGPSEMMSTFAGQSGSEPEQNQQGWAKVWIAWHGVWGMFFFWNLSKTNEAWWEPLLRKNMKACAPVPSSRSAPLIVTGAFSSLGSTHRVSQNCGCMSIVLGAWFDKSIISGRYHGFQYLMLVTFSTTTSAALSHDIMLIFSKMYWTFLRLTRICWQFQHYVLPASANQESPLYHRDLLWCGPTSSISIGLQIFDLSRSHPIQASQPYQVD